MDRAWLNKINKERRIDPTHALKTLREAEHEVAQSNLPPKVKALRTNELKRSREIREGCLFCYGVSQRIGQTVWLYPNEEADFDFVAAWEVGKNRHFAPTQLKEVVPDHIDPDASLQKIVDRLVDYRASEQLTVAVHLNRKGRFDPNTINLPALKIASLWVFGALLEDQSRWFLFGNMLESASFSYFEYPS